MHTYGCDRGCSRKTRLLSCTQAGRTDPPVDLLQTTVPLTGRLLPSSAGCAWDVQPSIDSVPLLSGGVRCHRVRAQELPFSIFPGSPASLPDRWDGSTDALQAVTVRIGDHVGTDRSHFARPRVRAKLNRERGSGLKTENRREQTNAKRNLECRWKRESFLSEILDQHQIHVQEFLAGIQDPAFVGGQGG